MEKDFKQIEDILNTTVNDLLNFINSNENYRREIIDLKKDYNVEFNKNFNIFTAFSDYYYKENLHSDILKYIFDPVTEKIGNSKYIGIFKNFIENKLGRKIKLDIDSIKIEREKDRIDLLMTDGSKNCILVENKINNAVDMEDQIGRYYSILKEKGYRTQAVIYLTLSPAKRLNKNYSIRDPLLRNEIDKILIEISAVSKKNENNFVDDIINSCIVVSNNMISTVFLTEYASLLKYLGGDFMATELNTKAVYKIFENKETLNSFRIFGDLWDNKDELIGKVFRDYFQNELNFSIHSEDEDAVFKKFKEDINIGFHTDFSFGFVYTPGKNTINSSNRKLFKELMENGNLKEYFTEDKVDDNGWWVCKKIDNNKIMCLNDLKILEEKIEKIIKDKM